MMKIDIHVHTKKIKKGDSPKREIDPTKFCDIISSTDVKICAITNHNYFDLVQYNQIVTIAGSDFQVWPGVEIDIDEKGDIGHLLIIVNPSNKDRFANIVTQMLNGKTFDDFNIDIEKVVSLFDSLDVIYIPHYFSKSHYLSENTINLLQAKVSNDKRILKEAVNSISAGIFISHGHKTIYGSDIQDWNDYITNSNNLPDLRLPVDSFQQFCLLLEKDDSTIDSILSKKNHQQISLNPFTGEEPIKLEIYDDINILFGSKGTGKTEILKALSQFYNGEGHRTSVYESKAIDLYKHYDIKGRDFQLNPNDLNIDMCQSEFTKIRKSQDIGVTSIKKYFEYFSDTETNKISKKITSRHLARFGDQIKKIRLEEIWDLNEKVVNFTKIINKNDLYVEVVGNELIEQLNKVLALIKQKIKNGLDKEFTDYHSMRLFNKFVEILTAEVSRKTGKPEKPITTGFQSYANNRIEIELACLKIIENINSVLETKTHFVGNLGKKGKLFLKTSLKIQNGSLVDGTYRHLNSTNKNPQKAVSSQIKQILENVYSNNLFELVHKLNNIENGNIVNSIEDLILFKRFFEANHKPYTPSNGESAMILLTQELKSDKEIFLIDEPENSLGNDYINDFIVPLLKDQASTGKTVVIATHDANIAVRTLPYKSIYREHDNDTYNTYMGNPFSNNLICSSTGKKLDWKEMSMRTLEGGRDAFGERGKIYGNI